MFRRRQIQVHALLFDVLKTEQVCKAKRIVVAWILLIEGIDLVRILTCISLRVVILTKKARFQQ